MKENKYDDGAFFEKYSQMPRSVHGLSGAGEWEALRKMFPDFDGKRVLDLGCGFGWHCMYAAECGALSVIGSDISSKMLNVATEKNFFPDNVRYKCAPMEDLNFESGSFDVVMSSLAFHYIPDFAAMTAKISNWLVCGGDFIFSMEHPVFTAYGSQDWIYDENGKILHFPLDRYFEEGRRETLFLGEKVVKYHRTLTSILRALFENGFDVLNVVEPQPPLEMMDYPGMRDELRRPMMLLISAKKR